MSDWVDLYLDDVRRPPDGWTLVTTVEEAKRLLLTGLVRHASLDHDLGTAPMCPECQSRNDSEDDVEDPCDCHCKCHQVWAPTGYDLVKWMAETNTWPRWKPTVHSANPAGRDNMNATIERYFPSSAEN